MRSMVSQAIHWKTREELCSMRQLQNFQGRKGNVTSICKNTSREFEAICHKFNMKSLSNKQVASGEEVEHFRRELSQSVAEGSHNQNLYMTSRFVASESSSEIRQLCQERDHLNFHGRNLEPGTLACPSAVRCLEPQVAHIRR